MILLVSLGGQRQSLFSALVKVLEKYLMDA